MATAIAIYCRFSDGTFASLVNNSVTENTLTEIQTGGTGLAQVSGVSVGQAYVGKTMTHAVAKVSTEDANTRFDPQADAAIKQASLATYCTDGTSDVFTATAVDQTKTALLNKDGATIGQALSGKTIMKAYASYSSQYGLNESQEGNGAFYIESSEGQLKAMYPPSKVNAQELGDFQIYPVRINQNDTLSVMSDNS